MNTTPNIAPHVTANDGKVYLLPINPEWADGHPAEPGWYPASLSRDETAIRWFNNGKFSDNTYPTRDQQHAGICASKQVTPTDIEWLTPWWPAAEQARIHAQAIAAGLAIPPGYVPPQPEIGTLQWVKNARTIIAKDWQDFNAHKIQRQQIEAVQAVHTMHPNGTRVHTIGRVVICCLNGPELRPGVPDGPADQDIDAAIGHLHAMKTTLAKARAAAQKATP